MAGTWSCRPSGMPLTNEGSSSVFKTSKMPSAGVLKNLTLVGYESLTSWPISVQIQVWVNSLATNLTCTVSFTTVAQKTSCSDLVDTVSVNAQDTVSVSMTGLAATPGYTDAAVSMYASLE